MPKTPQKTRKKSPSRGGFRKNSGRKPVGRLRGIRASDDQWCAWTYAAQHAGKSVAAWIRDVADAAARKNGAAT